jgi:hypothetical protein
MNGKTNCPGLTKTLSGPWRYRCMNISTVIPPVLLFLRIIAYAEDQHIVEIRQMKKEIAALKSKTAEVYKEIEHVNTKAGKDSISFQSFISDHSTQIDLLNGELDSVKLLIRQLEATRGMLEDKNSKTEQNRKNFRYLTSAVSAAVAKNCTKLVQELEHLKIFNIERQLSALRFLSGEIKAGTVDAIEGIERYYQVVMQIEKQSRTTESWTGPAPNSMLKGEVSYIRVGFIWLACITADNTAALLWDAHSKNWIAVKNSTYLSAVRDAVSLSAGRAAPKLIGLPFNHTLVTIGKGGEK